MFEEKIAALNKKTEADIEYKGWAAIKPMKNSADLQTIYDAPLSLEYHLFANHGTFSTVLPPAEYCRNEFALYVSPYRDRRHYSTTPTIIRITCGSEEICSVPEVFTRSSETEDIRLANSACIFVLFMSFSFTSRIISRFGFL